MCNRAARYLGHRQDCLCYWKAALRRTEVASLYFEGVGCFVFADLVAEVVVDGF